MGFWEATKAAFEALRANRLRTFLTLLGTVVGVVSVVGVIAITQGLNRYVSQEILAIGSHFFTIDKFGFITSAEGYFEALRRKDITTADAQYLRDHITTAEVVVPTSGRSIDVVWRGADLEDARLVGIGHGYPALGDRFAIAAGRHLTDEEIQSGTRVVVIGWDIADQLFGAVDPLGQRVRLGRDSYWVIGVLAQQGQVLGQSRDNLALIPIRAYEKAYGRNESISMTIKAASPELYEACKEEASMLLKIRRGKQPWEEPDFGLQTSETYYGFYSRATGVFYLAMIAIVALSLVVGGIVMMNIMLVTVTERTREIGLRKAIGARRRDIILQFLVEASVLSGSGGVIGVLIGGLIAWLVDAQTPLPARLEVWSVVGSLLLAVALGLGAGLYPAVRAARLVPVTALGYEK